MNNEREPAQSVCARRDVLKLGAGAAGAAGGATLSGPLQAAPAASPSAMPTRNLGRTGFRPCLFSLGGQGALERPDNDAVAVPIIERALDLGVNYLDTSSIYGGPQRWSERYFGQVMKRRRAQAYLASKTKERTRDGSLRMLEQSLKLLNTDHLDLWQLHDIRDQQDLDAVFAPGGAMEALQQAREQKLVRHLGITGHYRPEALAEAIRRFPFDTLLLAVNAADKYHYSFAAELLPLAVEKQLGIIGMKIPGRGRLLSNWTPPPVESQVNTWVGSVIARTPGTLTMREAMSYALTLPLSTVIIGCDSTAHVEENVRIASEFTPLSARQMAALETRAEPVSKQSMFFRYVPRT